MTDLIKIVVLGPESTGKSTLCESLARYFNTIWVPEYARAYLLKNGTDYVFDDLLTIAQGQLNLETNYTNIAIEQNKALLIIDTDQYVMKVWCEFVFNDCHNWILNQIVAQDYDLYLLCKPDLPWVKDELREYPDEGPRQQLFHMYKDLLIHQSTPWVEISGSYEERTQRAIAAVKQILIK
ncbi:AAA family ATPase [Polluticaenibacter yanchengensis]|uniref:AAA family ATPase n=1 Tax=Polluticaenibacter yanchengensis TaxID=3014562 RepID=A0ABT4UPJ8_9BACT|nr:AAA family ATPase [Chitinophagaceae bacterium LY-5]